MHRLGNTVSSAASRKAIAIAAAAATLLGLAACTSANSSTPKRSSAGQTSSAPSGSPTTSGAPSSAPASSSASASAAVITATAVGGATSANPARPITVSVANGTLSSVKLVNPAGRTVAGSLGPDGKTWTSSEDLGYSRTYKLTAVAQDGEGASVVKHAKFTTLTPNNQTMPYFNTVYGNSMQNGATYGVGMVAVVSFDEDIPDKKAAEKALTVTTTPHVDGAWYWTDNHTAHWRPQNYYTPGTKVRIDAKVYGTDLGHGLFGQADASTSFTVGAKHISIANAKSHYVSVYFGDKLVRSMPTSMGQGGWVQGKNGQISLWTMPGVYTVINHENPAVMSSDSYGLPASSPYGYKAENVPWATKISTDGIYLHELDTTVWAQGSRNLSHGCLNLNYTNAKWFYQHSIVGDVVRVINSGGPAIKVWQGGDWSVPWSEWSAGGAAA
ncbi:MAG TPA: Ig-like domain-containing protein [Jatrophihabitans sp.]|jgi:lipoprotein-anchoring transpeptidase ErfK/SrfK|uniref:L,D-transpeptidase n=1 Tax=Jatrophihabitans sp. TaxID=1932789 RepID=UPI002E0A3CF6|nr:Ig-like domain-containing protein [Jatrophihabitans sp.]